ncbi:MAG: UDP-N-acetylmuramoyl-L-alanine--D-glutamate ligase [Desulfocapsa sp.]|nr:UDP-N-acetylmuramoyl-L-alanine--D-glutamate ligase [Desulfocapsa sp.]
MMETGEYRKIESGQRAVVMGMGVSGRAAVKFLLSHNVEVSVSDNRQFTDLSRVDQDYLQEKGIAFEGGGHSEEFFSRSDFIVISPGIPTDLPLLVTMRRKNIPVLGELALAAPYLTECVVAVTGTNGKTTVAALLGELLSASGKKVFVGGNIGTPILDYLRRGERVDVLVLELSSFQLESAGNFSPHIGVLLNISPDHLDRHGSMARYAAAKMKLFTHQKASDKAILCADDPMCQQLSSQLTHQEVYCFGSRERNSSAIGHQSIVTIRLLGQEAESYSLAGSELDSHTGLLNAEAAVLAVSLLGCRKDDIERGLKGFKLAAHRLQHVINLAEVDYYDDSKATNTGAVISALESFSGNIVLLAGGRDKGEDYTVLKEPIRQKVRRLILLGEAADAIAAAIDGAAPVSYAGSMEEAVSLAASLARPGDVVLLAPACSSFDMFDNYGQRGDVFVQAVMNLQEVTAEKAS